MDTEMEISIIEGNSNNSNRLNSNANSESTMKIVCMSDTHGFHNKIIVPEGDVLVHAGDAAMHGYSDQIRAFLNWMADLPHRWKIYVPGNHDIWMESVTRSITSEREAFVEEWLEKGVIILTNHSAEIDGIKFHGFSYTPVFCNWAFMCTDDKMAEKVEYIGEGTDILVSHGPPMGFGDMVPYNGQRVGSIPLANRIREVKPKHVICGHIHDCYGPYRMENTDIHNVSICNERYNPINQPVVLVV